MHSLFRVLNRFYCPEDKHAGERSIFFFAQDIPMKICGHGGLFEFVIWDLFEICFLRFGAWSKKFQISNSKNQINEEQKFKSQSVIGEGPILI